jgi:hypothetical protein
VVKALRFIEHRINAMIEIWGVDAQGRRHRLENAGVSDAVVRDDTSLLHGPQARDEGVKQDDLMLKGRNAMAQAAAATAAASLRGCAEPLASNALAAAAENSRAFERPESFALAELPVAKRGALFSEFFSSFSMAYRNIGPPLDTG